MTASPALSSPLRRLMRGSSAYVASNFLRAVLAFAMSLVIGRGLGDARFGRWTFCMAWASGMTMLGDLGLNVLLTREVAKPGSAAGQLLSTALVGKLLVLAPIGLVVFLMASAVGIEAESAVALRGAVFLALAGAAYGCLTAVFRAVEWFVSLVCLETGGLILQLLGTAWVIRAGGTVLDLVLVALGVQVVQLALALGLWQLRAWPLGRVAAPSWRLVTPMVRRSLPFAAAGLLGTVQVRSSPLLLGYLRSQEEIGWFGAAWRFGETVKLIPHGVFGAAFPVFAHEAASERSRGDHLLLGFERGLLALTITLASLLIVFASPILRWTYGDQFLPGTAALIWVAIGLVPTLVNSGKKVYLYASGDEGYAVRLSLMGVAIQLVASVPLISTLGPTGAAVSIALGEAAVWLPLRQRSKGNLKEHSELRTQKTGDADPRSG